MSMIYMGILTLYTLHGTFYCLENKLKIFKKFCRNQHVLINAYIISTLIIELGLLLTFWSDRVIYSMHVIMYYYLLLVSMLESHKLIIRIRYSYWNMIKAWFPPNYHIITKTSLPSDILFWPGHKLWKYSVDTLKLQSNPTRTSPIFSSFTLINVI